VQQKISITVKELQVVKNKLIKSNETMHNYVENSFCLPYYELLYKEWLGDSENMIDEPLFQVLVDTLRINVDKKIIEKRRVEKGKIIDTFHSLSDVGIFLYIDHFKDPTDQNDMVKVAIRYKKISIKEIEPLFFKLYEKSSPRCNFEIDYWNQSVYNIIFNSEFYLSRVDSFRGYKIYNHQ